MEIRHPPRRTSAANVWTMMCLITSTVLLAVGGLFFVLPSPWIVVMTCLIPCLAPLVVALAEVGTLCVAFRQTVPHQIKQRAIIALFLSLLAWGVFISGIAYMNAYCNSHYTACG